MARNIRTAATLSSTTRLSADGKVHVAITGRGIIDGSALTKKTLRKVACCREAA